MELHFEPRLADRSTWRAEECSLAKAMDAVGSKSTMLLLREALYGTTRFDDFVERSGVSESVTAARLRELVDLGVLVKRAYQAPGERTRNEYVLTQMGHDLLVPILALLQWGDRYLQEGEGPLRFVDEETRRAVAVTATSEKLRRPCSIEIQVASRGT